MPPPGGFRKTLSRCGHIQIRATQRLRPRYRMYESLKPLLNGKPKALITYLFKDRRVSARGVCAGESCDLLVVDRAFDPIAPVIHEWTYEAIASDILELQNNVFRYQADTQGGEPPKLVLGYLGDLGFVPGGPRTIHVSNLVLAFRQQGAADTLSQRSPCMRRDCRDVVGGFGSPELEALHVTRSAETCYTLSANSAHRACMAGWRPPELEQTLRSSPTLRSPRSLLHMH